MNVCQWRCRRSTTITVHSRRHAVLAFSGKMKIDVDGGGALRQCQWRELNEWRNEFELGDQAIDGRGVFNFINKGLQASFPAYSANILVY